MVLESGNNVTLHYVFERTRGTTPTALGTPTSFTSSWPTVGAGTGVYTRGSGSWVTEGFYPGQQVTIAGHSNSENNGTFRVVTVTATVLTTDNTASVSETPASGTTTFEIRLSTIRANVRNVNVEKDTLESGEVRTTGQEADSRHGSRRVVGQVGGNVYQADLDDFIQMAMRNTFSTVTITSGTSIDFNTVDATTRAVGADFNGFTLVDDGVRPGDFITLASMGDSENDGRYRVTAVTNTSATLWPVEETRTPVTVSADGSGTVTYPGKRIDLGNTMYTVTSQTQYSGITKYKPLRHTTVGSMAISLAPAALASVTFEMLGASSDETDEGEIGSNSIANSAPVAATSNAPFTGFDGVVFENGTPVSVVTQVDFTVGLNRSLVAVIGSDRSPDVFDGTSQVSGNMTFFLEDSARLQSNFIDETEVPIYFGLESPDNTQFMSFNFPRVKVNGATENPPQSGPVPATGTIRCLEDATYATTMWVQVGNS